MNEWIKANGRLAPAVIGLPLLFTSAWIAGACLIVLGVLLWAYGQSWFPLSVSRRGHRDAEQSDLELAAEANRQAQVITSFLAEWVRASRAMERSPRAPDETTQEQWERGVNRSASHDKQFIGRWLEEHQVKTMVVLTRLRARRALSKDEEFHVKWLISGPGFALQLDRLTEAAEALVLGKERLELGHKMPDDQDDD